MDNVYLEDGLRMANRRVRERKEQKNTARSHLCVESKKKKTSS